MTVFWGSVGAREVLPGTVESVWDGKEVWNATKAGCRFVPGSAGRSNCKAKGRASECLL